MRPVDVETWMEAVIELGERYAVGAIDAAELARRMAELRTPEAMALIDAVDEIDAIVSGEDPE